MIILASQSPRRHELMKLTGLPFTVRVADIDETMDPALPVQQEVTRVSRRKAQAIAAGASPDDIVIAADTIVVIDGRELGKPRSEEEALGMLRLLSGRTHEVVTVLSVCKGSQLESEAVVTKVTFRTLCEEDRRAYGQGRKLRHSGLRGHVRQPDRGRLFLRHGPAPVPAVPDAARVRRSDP